MWSEYLGMFKAMNDLIDLKIDSKALRSVTYKKGPASRQIIANEIAKIRKDELIEPTNSE